MYGRLYQRRQVLRGQHFMGLGWLMPRARFEADVWPVWQRRWDSVSAPPGGGDVELPRGTSYSVETDNVSVRGEQTDSDGRRLRAGLEAWDQLLQRAMPAGSECLYPTVALTRHLRKPSAATISQVEQRRHLIALEFCTLCIRHAPTLQLLYMTSSDLPARRAQRCRKRSTRCRSVSAH